MPTRRAPIKKIVSRVSQKKRPMAACGDKTNRVRRDLNTVLSSLCFVFVGMFH